MIIQNEGITIKLKTKIEILSKLMKMEDTHQKEMSKSISKNSLKISDKQTLRSSKIINNEYDTLPGYEQIISSISVEEKEEIDNYLKFFNYNTLQSIFSTLTNKKFYSKIKTKQGLEIIINIYKDIVTDFNKDNLYINDECELYFCLKNNFNITELQCMDLYDLFKFNEFIAFTEQCFILFVYLISSVECNNVSDYFQTFSDELFSIVSGGENIVTISRIKEIGRLLDINERMLSNYIKELKFEENLVEIGKFKEFYNNIFKNCDDTSSANSTLSNFKQINSNNTISGKKNSNSTKNSNCMSKACNIL